MSDYPLPDDTRDIFRMIRMDTWNSIVAIKSICILLRRDDCPVDRVLSIAYKSIDQLENYWQKLDRDLAERSSRLSIPDLTREERWLFSQVDLPELPGDYPLEQFLQGFLLRYRYLSYRLGCQLDSLQTESGRKDVERCILNIRECLEWAYDRFR
ncbi:MAG: hypothetical protein L0154_09665 [Chloroflexi bacterium]|nr:hypothetical protein [Chloroflexota bacterium]